MVDVLRAAERAHAAVRHGWIVGAGQRGVRVLRQVLVHAAEVEIARADVADFS